MTFSATEIETSTQISRNSGDDVYYDTSSFSSNIFMISSFVCFLFRDDSHLLMIDDEKGIIQRDFVPNIKVTTNNTQQGRNIVYCK